MGTSFNFTLNDLASNNTSTDTTKNPFLREYLKTSPTNTAPTTSSAYLATKGQSYDTVTSTSMLTMSDVMMGVPLQNSTSGVLNTQQTLVSQGLQSLGSSLSKLSIFKALIPSDVGQAAGINTPDPSGSSGISNAAAAATGFNPDLVPSTGIPTTSAAPGGLPTGNSPSGLPPGFVMYPNTGVPVLEFLNNVFSKLGDPYNFGSVGPNIFDCCLVGDSMIQTTLGPVMIKDIQPGDFVYSWLDGNLVERKVIATKNQGKQQIYEVRTRNRSVKASANHPFLVAQKQERSRDSAGRWNKIAWNFEWKRLDTLKRGDLIVTFEHDEYNFYNDSTRAPIFDDPYVLTEELAWFLGLFVGDGHVCDGGFRVCVYGQTRAKLIEVLSHYGLNGTKHPTHGVYFSSVKWQKVLESFGIRVPSHQKFIPDIIWRSNAKLQGAFLRGFWDADGSYGKEKNAFCYHSSSIQLIKEVRLLHIMLRDNVSNISVNNRKDQIIIKNKEVKVAKPLYTFTVWFNSNRNMQSIMRNQRLRDFIPDDRFAVQRIAEIRTLNTETTWDIEIEDSHNYISDGVVVHNSGLVLWSLQQLGSQFSSWPHYSGDQYQRIKDAGLSCSLEQAYNTAGALLFVAAGNDPAGEHVSVSLGNNNGVIGAWTYGVGVQKGTISWDNWDVAGLIPGLDYSAVVYGNGISTMPNTASGTPQTRASAN